MLLRRVISASVVLCLVIGPALADDLNPPAWRGGTRTTFGEWEFTTSNPTPPPEPGYVYPWGLPTTEVFPGLFQNWLNEWGGRQGVWPLSGEIYVTIPNNPEPLPYKDIWIQLTWAQQAPSVFPAVSETRFSVPATLIAETPLPNGWFHSTYEIQLFPNPDWEKILITGAINVDELVIDTQCVPEPGSVVLLVLGGLAVGGWSFVRRR
jgi:hypothetical protein